MTGNSRCYLSRSYIVLWLQFTEALSTQHISVRRKPSGRLPLYELPQWTTQYDGRLFGRDCQLSQTLFNDDRYGRALDKLHKADRASLMTDLVLRLIVVSELDLSQIHNDSTSVKTTGQMPGASRDGLQFARWSQQGPPTRPETDRLLPDALQ